MNSAPVGHPVLETLHDADTERIVLSSIIMLPDMHAAFVREIDGGAFYNAAHRAIFVAAREVVAAGGLPDLAGVQTYLSAHGADDSALAALSELVDCASTTDIRPHVARLRELAGRRELARVGSDLTRRAAGDGDLVDAAAEGADALLTLAGQNSPDPQGYDLATASLARFSGPAPAIDWLVESVIPVGTVGLLYGPGGAGKTTLAFDLACAVATATPQPWCGTFSVSGGAVLYLASEDPEAIWHVRADAARRRYGQPPERLSLVNVYGAAHPLFRVEREQLRTTAEYDRLAATLRANPGIRLVVLDGRSRLCGVEGAGNGIVPMEVAYLERLAVDSGAAIMLLHHSPKSSYGTRTDARAAARGETALLDACRFGLYLRDLDTENAADNGLCEQERRSTLVLSVAKCSYAAPRPDIVLRRGPLDVFECVADVVLGVSRQERNQRRAADDVAAVVATIRESPGASGAFIRARCGLPDKRARAALAEAVAGGSVAMTEGGRGAHLYTIKA